jgi:hypothetical protein
MHGRQGAPSKQEPGSACIWACPHGLQCATGWLRAGQWAFRGGCHAPSARPSRRLPGRASPLLQGHFSEKDAAEKMHCLLDFIAYAHSKNIIHRDLKPENILLSDKSPNAILKVIDFGTSDFCRDGQRLSQKFGTPYYVAPEVRVRRSGEHTAYVMCHVCWWWDDGSVPGGRQARGAARRQAPCNHHQTRRR